MSERGPGGTMQEDLDDPVGMPQAWQLVQIMRGFTILANRNMHEITLADLYNRVLSLPDTLVRVWHLGADTPEYEPCRECRGTGLMISHYERNGFDRLLGRLGTPIYKVCRSCGGDG
jgi:hypothetical protein